MQQLISLLVENKPGALMRVAGVLTSRGYNIESLTVAKTIDPTLSIMTIVAEVGDDGRDLLIKQISRLVNVIKAVDLTDSRAVRRELVLIKIYVEEARRAALLTEADASAVAASVRAGENVQLGDFDLAPDEILVDNIAAEGYAVESDGTYTVGISTEITPELRAEGYIRDIAHIVQNMRKNAGLEISDRIHLSINAPAGSDMASAIAEHTDYIANETLAVGINGEIANEVARDRHSVDGVEVEIALAKSVV